MRRQLMGCAARLDSTSAPGSSGFCAATNSFATRFMPSRTGVTTPTLAMRRKPHQRLMREILVQIANRRPVGIRELAVGVAGGALQCIANFDIRGYVGAAQGRDLDEGDLALQFRLGSSSAIGMKRSTSPLL